MKTRSITSLKNKPMYDVNINFDEASNLWRSNKKCIGNGSYKYICIQKTKSGNQCKREKMNDSCFCKMHDNQQKIQKIQKI